MINFVGFSISQSLSPFNTGFYYGCLLSLPLSTTGLISILRLFSQGSIAGSVSFLGSILGDCLFLSLVLFGVSPFISFWVSLFPTLFLIGNLLASKVFFQFALSPIQTEVSGKKDILRIFLINLLLSFNNINLINNSNILFDNEFLQFESNSVFLIGVLLGQLIISGLICLFAVDIFVTTNSLISKFFTRYLSLRSFTQLLGYFGVSLLLQASFQFPWNGYLNYLMTNSWVSNIFDSSLTNGQKATSRFPKFESEFQKRYKAASKTKEVSLAVYLLTNYRENFQDPNQISQIPLSSQFSPKASLEKNFKVSSDHVLKNYKTILTSKIANTGARNVERFNEIKAFHKIERVSKPIWRKGEVSNLFLYKDFYFLPEKPQSVSKTGLDDKPGVSIKSLSDPKLMNQYFSKNYYLQLKNFSINKP